MPGHLEGVAVEAIVSERGWAEKIVEERDGAAARGPASARASKKREVVVAETAARGVVVAKDIVDVCLDRHELLQVAAEGRAVDGQPLRGEARRRKLGVLRREANELHRIGAVGRERERSVADRDRRVPAEVLPQRAVLPDSEVRAPVRRPALDGTLASQSRRLLHERHRVRRRLDLIHAAIRARDDPLAVDNAVVLPDVGRSRHEVATAFGQRIAIGRRLASQCARNNGCERRHPEDRLHAERTFIQKRIDGNWRRRVRSLRSQCAMPARGSVRHGFIRSKKFLNPGTALFC